VERSSESETDAAVGETVGFEPSDFGLLSDFGFQASDLGLGAFSFCLAK
jgi:hypothetical protein